MHRACSWACTLPGAGWLRAHGQPVGSLTRHAWTTAHARSCAALEGEVFCCQGQPLTCRHACMHARHPRRRASADRAGAPCVLIDRRCVTRPGPARAEPQRGGRVPGAAGPCDPRDGRRHHPRHVQERRAAQRDAAPARRLLSQGRRGRALQRRDFRCARPLRFRRRAARSAR